MNSKQLAKLTITRLTRTPTDWREAMERQPGELLEAYQERLTALNRESGGKVCSIHIYAAETLKDVWPFIDYEC